MCVVRQDVTAALDCLTVGTVTLRGIVGDLYSMQTSNVCTLVLLLIIK